MLIKIQSSLMISIMLFTSGVQAKTATEVFEKVAPSVVVIETYDFQGKRIALGSGVVLEENLVVTNCHVVEKADTINVTRLKTNYQATLRHSDWERDVCSLAVAGLKGKSVSKGNTQSLKVGNKVYAVGAPKGLELTLSDGLISGLRPAHGGHYLQITAPVSPGSSGGGLFDDNGLLLGLPTFVAYPNDGGQLLNFAVPVEWINELPKRNAPLPKEEHSTSIEWLYKAGEFEAKKDWLGMVTLALNWAKAQPDDVLPWYILGDAYSFSGQSHKAIEAYKQAVFINSKIALVWHNLGKAYVDSGQLVEAAEAFREAIRLDPEYTLAWFNLGTVWSNTGHPEKAIKAFEQAILINSEHAESWHNLGTVYWKMDQLEKATEAFKKAIRFNPDFAEAWYNLGTLYGSSGQLNKAIESFKQAIHIKPDFVEAWWNLGFAYKKSSQTNLAKEVYKHLKTLAPTRADLFFDEVLLQ